MGRRGRVDAKGPKFGDRRRRPRPVARPFWIPHFGKLRLTEGRPWAEFDADGCGTPRDTSPMPVGGSLSRFGRCRTELKSGTRRHISRNLTCQYDLEVHDDAGDVVERGWEWVGGVEWMPRDPSLATDGGVLGLQRGLSGFHISANCDVLRADHRQYMTRTGAGRLGTRRGCQSVEVCPSLGAVVRS